MCGGGEALTTSGIYALYRQPLLWSTLAQGLLYSARVGGEVRWYVGCVCGCRPAHGGEGGSGLLGTLSAQMCGHLHAAAACCTVFPLMLCASKDGH